MANINLVLSGHLKGPLTSEQLTQLNKWLMSLLENRRIKIINVCGPYLDAYVRMAVMEAAREQKRKRDEMCINIGPLYEYHISRRSRRKKHRISTSQVERLFEQQPQMMIAIGDTDKTTQLLWKRSEIISIGFPRDEDIPGYASSKILQDNLYMGISQMVEGYISPANSLEDCIEKLSIKGYLDKLAQRFITYFKGTITPAVQLTLDDLIHNTRLRLQPTT